MTLALSKKSVEFFKSEAARHSTQYQRMIRRLLDAYVDAQPVRVAVKRTTSSVRKGTATAGRRRPAG